MPRSSQNDSAPALAAEVNTFARARSSSTLCVRALVCHSLVLQRKLIVADSRQTDPYLELKRACEAVMEWAQPDFMYAHRPTVLRPPSYAHRRPTCLGHVSPFVCPPLPTERGATWQVRSLGSHAKLCGFCACGHARHVIPVRPPLRTSLGLTGWPLVALPFCRPFMPSFSDLPWRYVQVRNGSWLVLGRRVAVRREPRRAQALAGEA